MSQYTQKFAELIVEVMTLKVENDQLKERIKFIEKQNLELLRISTQREIVPVQPSPYSYDWLRSKNVSNICSVCGLNFDGRSMGYVCTNSKCPTAVTCK